MKLPPIIMTPEEIEQAEEESLERERDWLDAQQAKRSHRKTPATVEPRMLSTREAAKYLSISEWTLRQMVHAGEIPVAEGKYWRFDVRELDKWIEKNQKRLL